MEQCIIHTDPYVPFNEIELTKEEISECVEQIKRFNNQRIMTREQAIKRWTDIANTIFWSEERIAKEWDEKLRKAPSMTKEEQHELAQAYCRAIAVEITKDTSDEQLAEME